MLKSRSTKRCFFQLLGIDSIDMIFNNVTLLISRAISYVTVCFQDCGFSCGYLYPTMHPLFVAEVSLVEIPTVLNCCRLCVPIHIVPFLPRGISESQPNHPAIDCAGADTCKSMRDKYLLQHGLAGTLLSPNQIWQPPHSP